MVRDDPVKTYLLFVYDDRYTAPNLDTINAAGDEHAKRLAAQRLAASPHYLSVKLWEDERPVCRIDRRREVLPRHPA